MQTGHCYLHSKQDARWEDKKGWLLFRDLFTCTYTRATKHVFFNILLSWSNKKKNNWVVELLPLSDHESCTKIAQWFCLLSCRMVCDEGGFLIRHQSVTAGVVKFHHHHRPPSVLDKQTKANQTCSNDKRYNSSTNKTKNMRWKRLTRKHGHTYWRKISPSLMASIFVKQVSGQFCFCTWQRRYTKVSKKEDCVQH